METVRARRWTREEFDRMVGAGIFSPGERVELIDGEIVEMTAQGSAHMTAITLGQRALDSAFGTGYFIRIQGPLALEPFSEPEPDIAVVSGAPRDYSDFHPSSAVLVVEVSDATLQHDRGRKGSLYARAQLQDYWIVNLIDRRVEVYRDPAPSSQAYYGWAYRTVRYFASGDAIAPLEPAGKPIPVEDLLP